MILSSHHILIHAHFIFANAWGGCCVCPIAPAKVRGHLGKNGFPLSTMWIPGIKFRSSGLAARAFIYCALSLVLGMWLFPWFFRFLSICSFVAWCDLIVLSNLYSWIAFFCTSECVLCRVYLCFSWLTLTEIHFQMYEQICVLFQLS